MEELNNFYERITGLDYEMEYCVGKDYKEEAISVLNASESLLKEFNYYLMRCSDSFNNDKKVVRKAHRIREKIKDIREMYERVFVIKIMPKFMKLGD